MVNEVDKIMQAVLDAKALVTPDSKDIKVPKLAEPVVFEKDAGKAITLNNQLDDYEFSRKTMLAVMENGNIALKEILRVACISDHPRAFEVVSTIMKTLGDSSKDLLKLQEQMIDMRKKMQEGTEKEGMGVQADGAFEGTLEQLLISEEDAEKAEKAEFEEIEESADNANAA